MVWMKKRDLNLAAQLLDKRSAEARKKKWGAKEFVRKLRAWGKLGGRPVSKAKTGLTKSKPTKPHA